MHTQHFTISGALNKPISIDLTTINNDPKPLVIFVHGFKGFKDWGTHQLVAKYFAQNGLDFLKFNFSHNGIGKADGDIFDDLNGFSENTFSKELFDLTQIITFSSSSEQFHKPTEIYLIGHSLGGGISIIQTATDKAVSKLVSWASISSFRNLWSPEDDRLWLENGMLNFNNSRTNQQMPIKATLLEDLNENTESLDILNAARNISQPWLIIHGKADEGVPPAHALELHSQKAESKLLLIPNADHVFCASHPWSIAELPIELKIACDATIKFFGS